MGKKKEKSDLRISEDDAVLQRDVLVYTEEWYKNADDYTHYFNGIFSCLLYTSFPRYG